VHHARPEAVLEDAVGFLEAPVDVADDDPRAVRDVPIAREDSRPTPRGPAARRA